MQLKFFNFFNCALIDSGRLIYFHWQQVNLFYTRTTVPFTHSVCYFVFLDCSLDSPSSSSGLYYGLCSSVGRSPCWRSEVLLASPAGGPHSAPCWWWGVMFCFRCEWQRTAVKPRDVRWSTRHTNRYHTGQYRAIKTKVKLWVDYNLKRQWVSECFSTQRIGWFCWWESLQSRETMSLLSG